MKKFNELNVTNSATVAWQGKELRTVQDTFVSDNGNEYKAHAIDVAGNQYMIVWEVINSETTDESEACDWSNPVRVISL